MASEHPESRRMLKPPVPGTPPRVPRGPSRTHASHIPLSAPMGYFMCHSSSSDGNGGESAGKQRERRAEVRPHPFEVNKLALNGSPPRRGSLAPPGFWPFNAFLRLESPSRLTSHPLPATLACLHAPQVDEEPSRRARFLAIHTHTVLHPHSCPRQIFVNRRTDATRTSNPATH